MLQLSFVCVCVCIYFIVLDHVWTHLDERTHVGKVRVHGASVWKILVHPLHQLGEAAEGHDLWDTHQQSREAIRMSLLHSRHFKFNAGPSALTLVSHRQPWKWLMVVMSHTTSHDVRFTDRHPEPPAGEPGDRTCPGRSPCPNAATRNCKDKEVFLIFFNLAVCLFVFWRRTRGSWLGEMLRTCT